MGNKHVVPLEEPLVENEHLPQPTAPEDVEAQAHSQPGIPIWPLPGRARRVSATAKGCSLLSVVIIVVKILLYRLWLSSDNKELNINDWAIPTVDSMNEDNANFYNSPAEWNLNDDPEWNNFRNDLKKPLDEINEEQKYEKIDVPDFRDDRRGRFIHDFNTNITGIIDITGHRCFVMPLNREVDTVMVRKSMTVVLPPITDTSSIGGYISSECDGLPIYKLEKYEGGVMKRAADLHAEAKFAQSAGKGITELDIVNLDDVLRYQKMLKH